MGQLHPPATILQFKNQFSRDFVYGPGLEAVRDVDIQNGLNAANSLFNPDLFDTSLIGIAPDQTSEALICYLNASAHFMVLALQAAGGLGIVGRGVFSSGEGPISNKSVGGVSVTFAWPSSITDNPALFQFMQTKYGMAYLQVLVTRLVGNVGAVMGEMTPVQSVPII